MRNKKAKKIRQEVFGDKSIRYRQYTTLSNNQIISNPERQEYQNSKKIKIK